MELRNTLWNTLVSEQVDENYNVLRHYTSVPIKYDYVKKLTFKGLTIFKGDFTSNSCTSVEFQKSVYFRSKVSFPMATDFLFNGETNIDSDGTFNCTNAKELRFNYIKHEGKIMSAALKDIYYQSRLPYYKGSFSDYFTGVPGSQITAHVYDKPEEWIADMHNSTVWCDFKDIIDHKTQYDVTLTSNGGGEVQLWKTNGSNSQLQYTMSEAGGEETVPLYDNAYSYQIRLYYNPSIYEKPVLRRNGVEVNTTDGSGYCYYYETDHMNVNSYEVEYNKKPYRQLHLLNFGNGIVTLTGKEDGQDKTCTINGATDTYYGFDNTNPVRVDITPEEGDEVQKVKLWGYQPSSFTTDATTGVSTMYYSFDDDKSQQSLEIYYKKKTIPDGTRFNLHMSVEGTSGAGYITWTDEGNFDWLDEDIDNNYFSRQMDPGDSQDVIGIYDSEDNPGLDFYVTSDITEEEVAVGITNTVKVYSNRGLVDSSHPGTDWGDYYRIPLDGTDTDVRVVFETNGRYLNIDNGVGGSVAIYKEGNNTPLRTMDSGGGFYGVIPKTGNPYVVITPQEGRSVTAILRNGSMLSPSTYLQSDGTYRVPLQGFDRDDSIYQLFIIYSEDMTVVESTGITWSGVATGEILEEYNMFEAMLNDDANYSILTTYQETYSKFSQKFDEDVSSLKITLLSKDGYDFKVYFNGEEFPHTFTKTTLSVEQGLSLYSFETTDVATILPYLTNGTWVVEFKKGITWTAVPTGDVAKGMQRLEFYLESEDPNAPALIDLNLTSENTSKAASFNYDVEGGNITPGQVIVFVTFKPGYEVASLTFNGIEYKTQLVPYYTSGNTIILRMDVDKSHGDDLSPFLVDGTWVVEFKKVEGITWDGLIIGDVPQGATVDLGLDGMTMEVFLNSNEKSSSDTYTGSTESVGMDAIITAPAGYNFKVWFNGEEKTKKFNESGVYSIPFNNPTEVAPYLQDGQWIILFYDDVERYDVNRDGTISIADVTKLVNKILGKE